MVSQRNIMIGVELAAFVGFAAGFLYLMNNPVSFQLDFFDANLVGIFIAGVFFKASLLAGLAALMLYRNIHAGYLVTTGRNLILIVLQFVALLFGATLNALIPTLVICVVWLIITLIMLIGERTQRTI